MTGYEVAIAYLWTMAVLLGSVMVEEQWKVGTWLANLVYDLMLKAWCAMMRHTGDPIYTYQPRRYR